MSGKHSHLTDERQALLEAVGFIWDLHDAAWEENYSKMVAFWREHGHCQVPASIDRELKTWAKRQRRHYRHYQAGNMQLSTMTEERINRLNSINFRWELPSSDSAATGEASSAGARTPRSNSSSK